MVKFIKTIIEGFGSLGILKPVTYNWDTEGLNIIRGKNGSGKTSLVNALCWNLYGKTIKKNSSINTWPGILPKGYKGTKVTTIYSKDGLLREVIHCNNYKGTVHGDKGKSRIILLVDGVVQDKLRDKEDVKKWIIRDLGMSFELFKSSIVFGQKLPRIMEEDGGKRNKILEEVFELQFIAKAKIKIEERLRENKPRGITLETEVEGITENIVAYQENKKLIKSQKTQFNDSKASRIQGYEENIQEITTQRSHFPKTEEIEKSLEKIIHRQRKLEKRINKKKNLSKKALVDQEFRLDMELNTKKSYLGGIEQELAEQRHLVMNIPKQCSECGALVPEVKKKKQKAKLRKRYKELKAKAKALEGEITKLTSLWDGVKKELASIEQQHKRADALLTNAKALEDKLRITQDILTKLREYEQNIKIYQGLIKDEKLKVYQGPSTKDIKIKIKKATKKLKAIQGDYLELKQSVDMDEWLIKYPLANNGLKAYIFETLLSKTNNALLEYEPILGYKINLSIDLSSKRKDFKIHLLKYSDNTEQYEGIPHEDLSGGQKQLGDFCLALAIHDTKCEQGDINLLVMDEVFESLDEENIDKVGDILATKSQQKNIHLITHLNSFNPHNSNSTLVKLTKQGMTKVIQL